MNFAKRQYWATVQYTVAILLTITLGLPFAGSVAAEQKVPTEIGGFVLGSSVTDYPDIEHSNYLKQVVVTDWHGFRKGIISYGVCDQPGMIVKVQLKYEDGSKKFFKKLLKTYKERFGAPVEWGGDSFGILHKWKWKFTDEAGRQIYVVLQHNRQDHNHTIGNQVRMSLPKQEERERLCFVESCETSDNEEQQKRKMELKKPNWDLMIPR